MISERKIQFAIKLSVIYVIKTRLNPPNSQSEQLLACLLLICLFDWSSAKTAIGINSSASDNLHKSENKSRPWENPLNNCNTARVIF